MTRRLLTLTSSTLVATALVPATVAQGAKPAPLPVITKVEPLRLGIGDTMTITGRNFRSGSLKNTVIFKRDGKRAIFVKARTATTTKLTVIVPESLRTSLGKQNGALVPTTFRVRVLARRFAKTYTTKANSPVIAPLSTGQLVGAGDPAKPAPGPVNAAAAPTAAPVLPPANCDNDALVDDADADDDNDGMTDAFEAVIKTDRCNPDTDGDSLIDTWEYESAIDLNSRALPYPGKRPYPNPLDGADLNLDFDGDGLLAWMEHKLWDRMGGRGLPLNYSDGDQTTGPTVLATGAGALLDNNGDGQLADDEKDADGDRMGNYFEATGPLSSPDWWAKKYTAEKPYPLPYQGTDFADADVDGDTVLDGDDDIDHDGWSNVDEARRVVNGPWVHPFNPCLPNPSAALCKRELPLEGDVWPPFDRAPFKPDENTPPPATYCTPLQYPFVWPQVPAC